MVAVLGETKLIVIHKRKDSEAVAEKEVDATPSELTLLVYESSYSREEIHRSQPQSVYSRDKFLHKVGNSLKNRDKHFNE